MKLYIIAILFIYISVEFIYLTEGCLKLGMGQELFHMEEGDFAVLFPEVIHHCQVFSGENNKISSNEKIAKHEDWVKELLEKYPDVNAENIHAILQKEVGLVFVHVLEDAGVYKCTPKGREAFMRFADSL